MRSPESRPRVADLLKQTNLETDECIYVRGILQTKKYQLKHYGCKGIKNVFLSPLKKNT